MRPLTADVVESVFDDSKSPRKVTSMRLGLPSAKKVMNAVGNTAPHVCVCCEMLKLLGTAPGGDIKLYQNDCATVVCRLVFPMALSRDRLSAGTEIETANHMSAAKNQDLAAAPTGAEDSIPDTSVPVEIAGSFKSCVIIEDDQFQNNFYGLMLPTLLGVPEVVCLGIDEAQGQNACSTILGMDPHPELVISDYLLDYTARGRRAYVALEILASCENVRLFGQVGSRTSEPTSPKNSAQADTKGY